MDQPAFLPEKKKSAGLVFTLFIILMAVENCNMQKKAGFVIQFTVKENSFGKGCVFRTGGYGLSDGRASEGRWL